MKRTGKLLALTIIAVVVLVAAVISSQRKSATPGLERALLFPDFREVINDISTLSLKSGDRALTIVRDEDQWVIAEADNYVADIAKIRQVLIEVAELEVIEAKTSNPDRYATLGVEDPGAKESESVLLEIKRTDGSPQFSLIIGKRQLSSSPGAKPGRYLRLPEQEQALLVSGPLDVGSDAVSWIDRDLLNIDPARVSGVSIEHPDGGMVELSQVPGNDDLVLAKLPDGKEAKDPTVLNRMKDILKNIRIENVMKGDSTVLQLTPTMTTVTTADGLIARIRSAPIEDATWVSFSFEYDSEKATKMDSEQAQKGTNAGLSGDQEQPADVGQEVIKLQSKTAGWLFRLPDYQLELITRTLDRLSQDKLASSDKKDP